MNIGIIISSKGSVFKNIVEILQKTHPTKYNFFVVRDRECAIDDFCLKKNIEVVFFDEKDNQEFSKKTFCFFRKRKIDFTLLFFTRIVTKHLYKKIPTFNIHPSLLPAFIGFQPIKRALKSEFKYLGVTLHEVDGNIDCGRIIAQGIYPIYDQSEENLNRISFIQKVYIALLLMELMEKNELKSKKGTNKNKSPFFNPSIQNAELTQELLKLVEKEKISFTI